MKLRSSGTGLPAGRVPAGRRRWRSSTSACDGCPQLASGELLRVENLTIRFGSHLALAGVDLCVRAGTAVALVGSNGSGKSSLLGAIAGLLPATAGRVHVDRRTTALVLQSTSVDRTLPITVADAVRMGRYRELGLTGRLGRRDRLAVEAALARTRLDDLADRQLHQLSGGQRQRVLVAQGLAQEAALLLLDEPTTGLDATSRAVIAGVIAEERRAGRGVVMATHSAAEAARCDLVVVLDGRVVAAGAPAEVLSGDRSERVDPFGVLPQRGKSN